MASEQHRDMKRLTRNKHEGNKFPLSRYLPVYAQKGRPIMYGPALFNGDCPRRLLLELYSGSLNGQTLLVVFNVCVESFNVFGIGSD